MMVDIRYKVNTQMLVNQLQNIMEKGSHSYSNKKKCETLRNLKTARSI